MEGATEERDFSKYISENVKLDDGPPARYQLRTDRLSLDGLSDEESKLRRFTVGSRDPRHMNRTVLLVGATGSGKSTLINALVNFVMGVKFEDRVWFEIVVDEKDRPESETQTTAVSVYEVFGFEGKAVPYSLTIIDTPGYGDTRGIEYDDVTTKLLQDLFCVRDGLDSIDAVGLVLKASENRLDERMAYIFNSVASLFGKDMEQNIIALMTHSDGMKPKGALRALDEANIKCARNENNEPVHFLFNNIQKEKIENSRDERAARNAFETSEEEMKLFTEIVGQCHPRSLKTTVEVMKERTRLTACIQNLKERVETIEIQQEAINKNKEELSKHKEEMEKDNNFIMNKQEVHKEKQAIHWFGRATTCNNCEENCHYPGCTIAATPSWCQVMKDGKCTSCTGKCPVEDHVKKKWIYVTKIRTVTTTREEMEAKYKDNKAESEQKTSLLEHLEKEMETLQQKKNQCLDEAFEIIQKLEQIALNVDSLFTYVHLKFLIKNMKERGDKEKFWELAKMKARMNERNKAAAKYFKRCRMFLQTKLKK